MKFLRVYNFFTGEPLADIWPREGDSVCFQRSMSKDVDWRQRHKYAEIKMIDQQALTAKPVWLEST